MRCPKCGGSGWDDENMIKCLHCHGSGEVPMMTNEEWLKSLSTEELAGYIATQCADAIRLWKEMQYWTANEKCKCNKWIVWLKEAHTDEYRS